MDESDIGSAVARLMSKVDYYLHCELDEEYEHDRPDSARAQLEAALRDELTRARSIGLVSSALAGSAVLNTR